MWNLLKLVFFGGEPREKTDDWYCAVFVPMKHYGEVTGDNWCDCCGLPEQAHPVKNYEDAQRYWEEEDDDGNV